MYFPVAGIEASPVEPLFFAFGISLFCSMSGISGAFLLLPYQISILGFDKPGVSATNQIFNILACPAGVFRYARDGRLLTPLAIFIAFGTLPGVFAGTALRVYCLKDPGRFMLFVSLFLFYMGFRMLKNHFSHQKNKKKPVHSPIQVTAYSLSGFSFIFNGLEYNGRALPIFFLSLLVGVAGGAYGVGGGAIMSPFLVSFFNFPVHAIAGACLFATFLTSVVGVGAFSIFAFLGDQAAARPDWTLGLLFGLGGIFGMYCGASLQKYMPERILRSFLIIIIISLGSIYLFQGLRAL